MASSAGRAGRIELVVTDLDGTLWDAQERIHDRTLAALRELERRRLPVLVATGRRPRTARSGLAREGLTPPAVVLDGAIGIDFATGATFHRVTFDRDDAMRVLDAFESQGLSPCVYVHRPDVDVVVSEAPSTSAGHLQLLAPHVETGDLRGVIATEDVLAIGLAGLDEDVLQPIPAGFAGAAEAAITRDLYFGGSTLIVRPRGVSKWQGVVAYCEQQGLDPRLVLALGDGQNDVELLTEAAVSCVVRDGASVALALADHLIEPPGEGGWSAVLDLC